MSSKLRYTPDELTHFGLNPEKIPRHIAIIMDGNGRWAGQRMRCERWGIGRGRGAFGSSWKNAADWGWIN
ncbi:MAG: hypothetical protein QM703_06830 [Gemmatales bacterium]